jgi:hypothetical protein
MLGAAPKENRTCDDDPYREDLGDGFAESLQTAIVNGLINDNVAILGIEALAGDRAERALSLVETALGVYQERDRPQGPIGAKTAMAAKAAALSCVRVMEMLEHGTVASDPDYFRISIEHSVVALVEASALGRVWAIKRLGKWPMFRWDTLRGSTTKTTSLASAVAMACANGRDDALNALIAPPWNARYEDASAKDNCALRVACKNGHTKIVAMLGMWHGPFRLGTSDARAKDNEALRMACANGHAEVVRMLGDPAGPWKLGPADARTNGNEALYMACANGHAEVVRMLGDLAGPWKLGTEDARAHGNDALRSACARGHTEVVRMLGDPAGPWKLGRDDALDARALQRSNGIFEMLEVLARPRFSLRMGDVEAAGVAAHNWPNELRALYGSL